MEKKKVEGSLLGLSLLLKSNRTKKDKNLSEYEPILQNSFQICKAIHHGVNKCLPEATAGKVIHCAYIWCAYAGIGLAYMWHQNKEELQKKGYIEALTEERGFYEMDEFVSDLIGKKFGSDESDLLRMMLSDYAFDMMQRNTPYLDDGQFVAEQTREDYIAMLLYGLLYERSSIIEQEIHQRLVPIFTDVKFFSFAEGGAMGGSGEIIVVNGKKEKHLLNYIYSEINIDDIEEAFPVLCECRFGTFGEGSKVPMGWNYVYLGMGNHLVVADEVYEEFHDLIKDYEMDSKLYGNWQRIAEGIIGIDNNMAELN